ncbi:ABC1 kinase family protein [Sporosarcina sp. FA9]|uniref:ABC1 kinase family protein n=1 Tax=Sporosarcina sp. FA9 TaxID=3413030 RepID=UPI003F65F0AC
MFKTKIRHSKRFQVIINTFLRNGFSHILYRLGITDRTSSKLENTTEVDMNLQDIGVKLRNTLQDLGPTFIKLGQIASSRHDLVPKEISLELAKLQDHVAPVSFEQIREIVEEELEDTIENTFLNFSEKPLATASIGQVHIAHLLTGEEVAVKIQRPDIQPIVKTDLSILQNLAQFLEDNTSWGKTYRLSDIIDEFSRSLRDEMDYRVEGKNGERIAKQFQKQSAIHIPKIYSDYSSEKVLTMEMIRGIKINDSERLISEGYDQNLIAKRVVDSMFTQVLEFGFFHGDPHPGNIYILPDNIVAYLDFGMIGRLDNELKYHFASLIINLQQGNTDGLLKTFSEMGLLSDETDLQSLKRDLDDLQTKYYDASLKDISLGGIFIELLSVAYRHNIRIPTEITLLTKAVLTLEGLISELDPTFSIMKAVEPFGKKLVAERFHPMYILKKSWHETMENIDILFKLPQDLKDITSKIKKGKLQLDINFRQAEKVLNRFDRISNRLSLSIILLSFSILMVGLIIGSAIAGQTNLLWNFPIIELGSIVATLMFLFLIYSIFRSGRT